MPSPCDNAGQRRASRQTKAYLAERAVLIALTAAIPLHLLNMGSIDTAPSVTAAMSVVETPAPLTPMVVSPPVPDEFLPTSVSTDLSAALNPLKLRTRTRF